MKRSSGLFDEWLRYERRAAKQNFEGNLITEDNHEKLPFLLLSLFRSEDEARRI